MSQIPSVEICHPPFTDEEIKQIVKVHRSELSGGFLSSLGDKALYLLFEHASECPTAVLLLARSVESGMPCGFLLGTYNTSAFYKMFLYRKGFRAAILLFPRMFSFRLVFKLIETLLYPRKKEVRSLPSAELLDIAVSSHSQGLGVGRNLFVSFCDSIRSRNLSKFRITTGSNLIHAHRFYERLGAHRVSDIQVHSGTTTFVFIYNLKSNDNQL